MSKTSKLQITTLFSILLMAASLVFVKSYILAQESASQTEGTEPKHEPITWREDLIPIYPGATTIGPSDPPYSNPGVSIYPDDKAVGYKFQYYYLLIIVNPIEPISDWYYEWVTKNFRSEEWDIDKITEIKDTYDKKFQIYIWRKDNWKRREDRLEFWIYLSNTFYPVQGEGREATYIGLKISSNEPLLSLYPTPSLQPSPQVKKKTCLDFSVSGLTTDDVRNDLRNRYQVGVLDSNISDAENPPWEVEELLGLQETLCSLPSDFREKTRLQQIRGRQKPVELGFDLLILIKLKLLNELPDLPMGFIDMAGCKDSAVAFTVPVMPVSQITFCGQGYKTVQRDFLPGEKEKLQYTFVHEQTHTIQNRYGVKKANYNPYSEQMIQDWIAQTGWECIDRFGECFQQKPEAQRMVIPQDIITDYGRTNPFEDMAEAGAFYAFAPDKLQEISPRRFNFIKDRLFGGKSYGEGN